MLCYGVQPPDDYCPLLRTRRNAVVEATEAVVAVAAAATAAALAAVVVVVVAVATTRVVARPHSLWAPRSQTHSDSGCRA